MERPSDLPKHNAFKDQSSPFGFDREGNPQFYTTSGWLNVYSLKCGYCEHFRLDGRNHVRLEEQHGAYHVKGCFRGEYFWVTSRELAAARACFVEKVRLINQ